MRIALIGAGRLAAHLALALQAIGRSPIALGARDAARAAPLARALGLPVSEPAQAIQGAD
ncbi:MAG: NAD(P)-binding domain-containing protein, partial [Inhella sp.]